MLSPEQLRDLAVATIDDLKGFEVKVLDVRGMTSVTDYMVIASGRSDRQVRAIARELSDRAKAAGNAPLGMEGEREGEWVLIDLCDVVIHVMLPRVRDFYQLERLWTTEARAEAAG